MTDGQSDLFLSFIHSFLLFISFIYSFIYSSIYLFNFFSPRLTRTEDPKGGKCEQSPANQPDFTEPIDGRCQMRGGREETHFKAHT
jgi:hypothetical protein